MQDDNLVVRALRGMTSIKRISAIFFRADGHLDVLASGHVARMECWVEQDEIREFLREAITEEEVCRLETPGNEITGHFTNYPFLFRVIATVDGLEVTCTRNAE